MRTKVLHLVTRLDLGGAQQNTLHTVKTLDRSRFDVVLVCGRGGMLDEEALAVPGLKVVFLDSLVREINPFLDLLAFLELTKLFLAENPSVLHTHSSKAGILGRFAAALSKAPIVVHTYHGFGFHDGQNPLVKASFVFLERICSFFTDALIFVSKANIDYASKHGIVRPENAVLIRSGVSLSAFPAEVDAKKLKTSAGIGMHKKVVLSIGNLKPQKNAADFVAAAALVLKDAPETRFVFIGDGPQKTALQAKAFALGLEGKVLFLGWRRDAAQWLSSADAFVMTSLWEGLPRSLIEAMKSGLASVCYATDGVTDLLVDGENGFLVAPGDSAALAERLLRLLGDDALRARLGKAAASAIGPEYDIDGMVRAQEALYERLL